MKKIYLLLITILLTITLSITSVSASNGNEIIPFHPDPSLVTEWVVTSSKEFIEFETFYTPILKVIIPDEMENVELIIEGLVSNALGESILWIFPPDNVLINLSFNFYDSLISTIWFGRVQSIEPTMCIYELYINDGNGELKDIYMYPDVYIYSQHIEFYSDVNLYSYNFECELSNEYQSGYNDGYDEGWGEKNKMTDITFLVIGLIIFIIANVLGFIYKNNLLTALSGLLWLLPIFLVDNVFIKIFSVIIMLITFIFSFKERSDYYV